MNILVLLEVCEVLLKIAYNQIQYIFFPTMDFGQAVWNTVYFYKMVCLKDVANHCKGNGRNIYNLYDAFNSCIHHGMVGERY